MNIIALEVTVRNVEQVGRSHRIKIKMIKKCKNCGKEFSTLEANYCSTKCVYQYKKSGRK